MSSRSRANGMGDGWRCLLIDPVSAGFDIRPYAAPLQGASCSDRQSVSLPERPAISRRRSFDCCCGALNRAAHRRSIRRCSSRGILGCSSIASSLAREPSPSAACDRVHAAVSGDGIPIKTNPVPIIRSQPVYPSQTGNVVVEVRLTLCAGNRELPA